MNDTSKKPELESGAGPRELAIRERLEFGYAPADREDIRYLLSLLEALRPEEPPPLKDESEALRLAKPVSSGAFGTYYWVCKCDHSIAIRNGHPCPQCGSKFADDSEVASLRAQLTQQREYYQSALAGHVELQNDYDKVRAQMTSEKCGVCGGVAPDIHPQVWYVPKIGYACTPCFLAESTHDSVVTRALFDTGIYSFLKRRSPREEQP
jgi:hypothetical protein